MNPTMNQAKDMRAESCKASARKGHSEFAPLEMARAEELKRLINLAGRNNEALLLDTKGRGVTDTVAVDLIAPTENTNALVRFQRHY